MYVHNYVKLKLCVYVIVKYDMNNICEEYGEWDIIIVIKLAFKWNMNNNK